MGFSFAKMTCCLLLAGWVTGFCSAAAQEAGHRSGEAILFSSPDDDDVSSNVPSLNAQPPGSLDYAHAVQAPGLKGMNWGASSQAESPAEPPPPAISTAQAQEIQQLLDEKKNWALMTPEQILGLPTAQKILGVPNRDAFGQSKQETAVEQFFDRQEQLRVRTNSSYGAAVTRPQGNVSANPVSQANPDFWRPAGVHPAGQSLVSQFFNAVTNSSASAQAVESGWWKSFSMPAPAAQPAADQQAAAAQFQQLLQPHSEAGSATLAPALGGLITPASAPAVASAIATPTAIPLGASYTPLSTGITPPAGVTPLPGLLGPTNAPPPVFAPEWKPQAPPWESSAPQLGVVPQRKF